VRKLSCRLLPTSLTNDRVVASAMRAAPMLAYPAISGKEIVDQTAGCVLCPGLACISCTWRMNLSMWCPWLLGTPKRLALFAGHCLRPTSLFKVLP
jgi:hypothetical protein